MSNALATPTLLALKEDLRPVGYRKRGANFHRRIEGLIHIVSLQSSSSSTKAAARITLNAGICVVALQDPQRTTEHPSVWSAHWRARIGFLMPEQTDVWWTINSAAQASEVAAIITERVRQYVLPALESLATVESLRQLWESGRCAGLTDYQRRQYLAELQSIRSSAG